MPKLLIDPLPDYLIVSDLPVPVSLIVNTYNPAAPNATTDCSYVWPDPGSFTVTATIYWSVTWSAVGAAGGGSLGLQAGPSTSVPVTVTESQAVNTPGSGSD